MSADKLIKRCFYTVAALVLFFSWLFCLPCIQGVPGAACLANSLGQSKTVQKARTVPKAKPVPKVAMPETVVHQSPASPWRLPLSAFPLRYQLDFHLDKAMANFHGAETVTLQVSRPIREVIMNARDLQITDARLISTGQTALKAQVKLNAAHEQVIFCLPRVIPPGQYKLQCRFAGKLNDDLAGFYRSSFTDEQGKKHALAVTQMEPADARRMFPCFDEPAYKSCFAISVDVESKAKAISNMPQIVNRLDQKQGRRLIKFAESPRMSTYLVTLLVGEFEATAPCRVNGVDIRVWTVQGRKHLGVYARDMAAKFLPYLNDYFKYPYAWQKLDLIALPDFEAGAMENPGAITFRERYLLADPARASLESLQTIAAILAHEMAHLWFGDLVTMKWWDDIWLNEAFATWMAVKVVDSCVPQWQYGKVFNSERQKAMKTDALLSSRAIHAPVEKPADALQMFDAITYEKGASVLRMLELFVGESVFRQAIADYTKQFAFSNAATRDLWAAIGKRSHLPVAKMMQAWSNQAGYPLVSVTEKPAKTNSFELSQKRFLLLDNAVASADLWSIPLSVRAIISSTAGSAPGKIKYILLDTAQASHSLTEANAPYIFNAGGNGFYRVHYSATLLKQLLPHIGSTLDTGESLSLLSDQFALCQAGVVPVSDYLDLLKNYRNVSDLYVWKTILSQLYYLYMFVPAEVEPAFALFVQEELKNIANQLGWQAKKGEPELARLVRAEVIAALGTIGGDEGVATKCRDLWQKYLQDHKSVDADLLEPITGVVAFSGSKQDFSVIKEQFKSARLPEDEARNLFALAGFRDRESIEAALAMVLNGEVRSQDAVHLLGALLGSKQAGKAAWSYLVNHWPELEKSVPSAMLPHIISACDRFNDEEDKRAVSKFFAEHPVKAGESNLRRTEERLAVNVRFKQLYAQPLVDWLSNSSR